MKLKQSPDDFQVEEMTDIAPSDRGAFALYRMEKRGWSTPDALAAVRRRWKIELRRISLRLNVMCLLSAKLLITARE